MPSAAASSAIFTAAPSSWWPSAILTNRGLPAALGDLAGRAAVPVEVVAAPAERLPDQVEAAAYLVVSECLANIDKHAQATRATVSVRAQDGVLRVEVADDGVGGAELGHGSGLQGLEDRIGALDGRLELHSPPGAGTRLTARIPVDAAPAPALEQLQCPQCSASSWRSVSSPRSSVRMRTASSTG